MKWKLLLACAAFAAGLVAQSERGNIRGLVTDTTGAVVGGAAVEITNRATGNTINVTSTTAGEYNAANLSPGEYKVQVSATGFKRFSQENVTLTASGTVRVN